MQAQAQFTIHTLNDVVTSATAPSNPYQGQLWMKSSVTPPVLYTYNGSSWVEANGTSTLRTSVSTLTTKQSTLESNLNGLTSTVSSVTTRVTTLEDDMGTVTEDVETLGSSVSTLTQTAAGLSTRVSNAEGNITTITQNISGITARVSTASVRRKALYPRFSKPPPHCRQRYRTRRTRRAVRSLLSDGR